MTDFEKWRTCTPEEYRESAKNPAPPAEMAPDTPYLWMVSFGDGYGQQPGRIKSVQTNRQGISRISFITFDGSWHENERLLAGESDESNHQEGFFQGGLFKMRQDSDSGIFFPVPGGLQVKVREGYFIEDKDPSASNTEGGAPDEGIARTVEEMEELLGNPREPAAV